MYLYIWILRYYPVLWMLKVHFIFNTEQQYRIILYKIIFMYGFFMTNINCTYDILQSISDSSIHCY